MKPFGGATSWTGILTRGILFLTLVVQALFGQYFGRNKVQYEAFRFHQFDTEHFRVFFYPEEKQAAFDAGRMAERWYHRYSRLFRHKFNVLKPIIFYADHADFQQTNAISGLIGEGTGGVTEALKNRVVLPFTGYYHENDHVLGHELVHAFQYDMAQAGGVQGLFALNQLPLWMIEGLAEYLSVGRNDAHTAMWMRDALLYDHLPTLEQLSRDPRFFPYRYGQAVWAYVGGRYGDSTVVQLYRAATKGGLRLAIREVLGIGMDTLSSDWKAAVHKLYTPLLEGRSQPEDVGRVLLSKKSGAGEINLAPAVSRDGRYVAFISQKDLFSFDYFMADAHTGKILRKIGDASRDPHFDELSFISTSGTWSPDARQFAFVVFSHGDNLLVITDVESGRILKKKNFKQVGAITQPAWSPDGRYIAFSGMSGGLSDLYLYDLKADSLIALTGDRYAEMEPTWSPDGQKLAFVTDRGPLTDFDLLSSGPPQIAIMDLNTRQMELLTLFPRGKHINPQFSPDGQALYFISDQDGFSDIYRYRFEDGKLERLTRLATGVSGITGLSPALSVDPSSGRLFFSVYRDGHYNIHVLEPDQLLGEPVTNVYAEPGPAALLPPYPVYVPSAVSRYLVNTRDGLPEQKTFPVEPYRASLSLDHIGQPTIGISVNRFGTSLGGGVSMFFSDMLGNRVLGVALQANGTLKDIGGQAFYLNRRHQFNWGVVGAHIPYLIIQNAISAVNVNLGGQVFPGLLIQELRQRVFLDELGLILQYPTSTTRRFELNTSFTHISYDNELESIVTVGGQIVDRQKTGLPSPPSLNLLDLSAAYVGDNAIFGFTSPIKGSRFRFEAGPTVGDLNFVTVLADYRKYWFFNPFTVAWRGLHYGRYPGDEDSGRLNPLFLGYENFIRGYSLGSFESQECTPTADGSCPEIDRLVGSKIAVTNLELRIPLFGTESFGLINFPFFPTELALFTDAGVAWTDADKPTIKFVRRSTERIPVVSSGASLRVNMFGYLVFETYLAYPYQRPDKGWHFGFQILPGW